jgi:predicted ATPase
MCELAGQFLALAEKQGATVPRMVGHRIMGVSLLFSGDIAEARAHLDRGIVLYDPAEHRALATRFAIDVRVGILFARSLALWLLGYPEAALADTEQALKDAHEIGHAATLMFALTCPSLTHILLGNHSEAKTRLDEVVALADKKGTLFWKGQGTAFQGCVLLLTGKASGAVPIITSGMAAHQSTGATLFMPWFLSHLARANAELDHVQDAWRCIGEAMTSVEATKQRWCEAEVNRIAGE